MTLLTTTVTISIESAAGQGEGWAYVTAGPDRSLTDAAGDQIDTEPVRIDVDALTGQGARPLINNANTFREGDTWLMVFTVYEGTKVSQFSAPLGASPSPASLFGDLAPDGWSIS